MPSNKKLLQAAAGSAGGDNLFVEDVFSTFLYTGNNSTLAINNGLDLSGEGGLVWIKGRNGVFYHKLYDTARGIQNGLTSNVADAQSTSNQGMTAVTSTGFTLGTDGVGNTNPNNDNMASWSFRKAEGFCDIVTYTGNGSARTIAHNLGSVPKMIIVKSTSDAYNWYVYHASLTNQQNLTLDTTSQAGNSGAEYWNSTTATSSEFSLGTYFGVNGASKTYVAYLFGDDAVFGEDGDEQICKMGSYTGTGSNGNTITLGFEPQWLLWKPSSGTGDWQIVDSMRGWTADGVVNRLEPNTSDAEAQSGSPYCNLTSTGFVQNGSSGSNNANGSTYIYMAIRRPMKVPEAGTEVFDPNAYTATSNSEAVTTGFPVDLFLGLQRNGTAYKNVVFDRFRGTLGLNTASRDDDEPYAQYAASLDNNTGFTDNNLTSGNQIISYAFKRTPKFFDMVAYTGNGSVRTINHNLQVAPDLMIVKCRSANSSYWVVYDKTGTATDYLYLDSTNAQGAFSGYWNNTEPTSTVFTLGTGNGDDTNASSQTYIAYLFATLAGISKVGSYTGNATNTTIDCGFSNGARFILIKRTDATSDWYVYDSARGITTGISPYLLLNTTAAEVTNAGWLEAASSGFLVNDNATTQLNINNATYIFLAIA